VTKSLLIFEGSVKQEFCHAHQRHCCGGGRDSDQIGCGSDQMRIRSDAGPIRCGSARNTGEMHADIEQKYGNAVGILKQA
jgi:hypothetical protein